LQPQLIERQRVWHILHQQLERCTQIEEADPAPVRTGLNIVRFPMGISIEQLTSFLNEQEALAHELGRNFEPPRFVRVRGLPQFRHEPKSDLLMSYLKCLRAISSLNAALVLLRSGFIQEVGALCRCIDEFCEDVRFLATPLGDGGKYSQDQQRLVEEFFKEEFLDSSSPLLEVAPRNRVPRDKVRAGIARIQGQPINPHDANHLFRTIDKSFSGYVHGAYVHIMEMYGGPALEQCQFHTCGMLGTPRISEWTETLANYVYRLTLTIEIVAKRCNDERVGKHLEELRLRFEESTGLGTEDPNKLLKETKRS